MAVNEFVQISAPALPGVGSSILKVCDPTGSMEITEVHAPRLDTLEGKTICELSNDTWQAHRVFAGNPPALAGAFPTAKLIPYTEFPTGNEGIDTERAVELVARAGAHAVIIGNASGGACSTACGRSAARMEKRGIPAVVVQRQEFVGATKNAVAGFGFTPDAAMVIFPVGLFLVGSDLAPIGQNVDLFFSEVK